MGVLFLLLLNPHFGMIKSAVNLFGISGAKIPNPFGNSDLEGNFINGFYESETIRYGELGYGYPEKSQTMLNVPNKKNQTVLMLRRIR
ncbi:MAG: hypothetical protein FWC19_04515 [Treponema sp.]|nr:hypothetical protein [Treponema sp.]MCL2272053.1 hypothetical protein [Treponema sp.]